MTVLGLTGLWLAWRSRSWKASFVTVGMWGLAWVPKASWGVGLVACGAFVLGLLLIGGNRDQIYGFRKIWGVACGPRPFSSFRLCFQRFSAPVAALPRSRRCVGRAD